MIVRHSTTLRLVALTVAVALSTAACGRRGDPKPPEPEKPAAEAPAEEGTTTGTATGG